MRTRILLALLLTPFLAKGQFSLSGSVYDAKNEHPLAGATVALAESRGLAIADEQGKFVFENLPAARYTLNVTFIGYEQSNITLELSADRDITIRLRPKSILTEAVVVSATRASDKTPTTHTTVDRAELQDQNFGQDMPFLLNWTPSVVTTSDAGTGIGYTGIRIRGSDATRVNVTINGIPYNDSESQGTFWVDIPDIASSAQSVQIQRGVGTSTNGAGAFGGTINLQTLTKTEEPYAEILSSAGSFNTRRYTLNAGTGLLNDHWTIDGRVSRISSDGFIDRASAELHSYYLSAGYYNERTLIKGIVFGGHERTYQSWYGVPQSRLKNDTEAMLQTAANEGWNEIQTQNLLNADSRTFNPYLYDDQVDDYRQDHLQLHFTRQLSNSLTLNTALHYTPGKGYYEEYRYEDDLEDYGLDPVTLGDSTIESSDLVRRRWLNNHFYGLTYSVNHDKNNWNVVLGGAWNRYVGDHFGQIIWAQVSSAPKDHRYYSNDSDKRDFNIYLKANYQISPRFNAFADIQYRTVNYTMQGIDSDRLSLDIAQSYDFFNPKAGLTFTLTDRTELYGSFSVAHKEPVRDDFVDNPGVTPKPELLRNLEVGARHRGDNHMLVLNYYLMDYENQLVLTGEINQSGAPVRANVGQSYRTGIEAEGVVHFNDRWQWNANATLSQNRNRRFTEVLEDYGTDFSEYSIVEIVHENTDIAFSPSLIAASALTWKAIEGLAITWLTKYVGKQYLDNTSNENRALDPYLVNDLRLEYSWKPSFVEQITLSFLVNNLFDTKYESNGYTWGYLAGPTEYRENYYFPQAGRNFMGMLSIRF